MEGNLLLKDYQERTDFGYIFPAKRKDGSMIMLVRFGRHDGKGYDFELHCISAEHHKEWLKLGHAPSDIKTVRQHVSVSPHWEDSSKWVVTDVSADYDQKIVDSREDAFAEAIRAMTEDDDPIREKIPDVNHSIKWWMDETAKFDW